jgi:hypothetical protein
MAWKPVIDGLSLVDILKWADGEVWHGGITGIDGALVRLRHIPTGASGTTVEVLGCGCGPTTARA